jgi:hypothetical protein
MKELSTNTKWEPAEGLVCDQRTSPNCTGMTEWRATAGGRSYFCCEPCREQHDKAICANAEAESVMLGGK